MKDDDLSKLDWVKNGLHLDFSDMDSVEFNMLDLANRIAMLPDTVQATQGRALRAAIPGWVAFLKAEQDRDEPMGPGNAIYGMARTYAMLLGLTSITLAKNATANEKMVDSLLDLLKHDLKLTAAKGTIKHDKPPH